MKNKNLLIAIDGPSASGKGTLAKKIAKHFNIPHLNTGALYRLIAYRLNEHFLDPNLIENHLDFLIKESPITEESLENEELFSEEIGALASKIAKNTNLRQALLNFQRDFAAQGVKEFGGAVLEGRDITTIICPDADCKLFVTADVEIRAKRRFDQLINQGKEVNFAEILQQLKARDESDFNRQNAPLKIADDAFIIDTSKLSVEESVKKILIAIET